GPQAHLPSPHEAAGSHGVGSKPSRVRRERAARSGGSVPARQGRAERPERPMAAVEHLARYLRRDPEVGRRANPEAAPDTGGRPLPVVRAAPRAGGPVALDGARTPDGTGELRGRLGDRRWRVGPEGPADAPDLGALAPRSVSQCECPVLLQAVGRPNTSAWCPGG